MQSASAKSLRTRRFIALQMALWLLAVSERAESQQLAIPPPPQHILRLTLPEFSVLNTALMDGTLRYGGNADCGLNLSRTRGAAIWTVTFTNKTLFDTVSVYVAQKAGFL